MLGIDQVMVIVNDVTDLNLLGFPLAIDLPDRIAN